MAQKVIKVDQEKLGCSICLDLLKNPVTIPCGHSYCLRCISDCWEENKTHSCPQCRQNFRPRPALVKNIMLARMVEELEKVRLRPDSAEVVYVESGKVVCDYCTGMKLKATKSCLVCMASFCEQHLQPHNNVALLKNHKLVEATPNLLQNICSEHNEAMKIFCRTDQQCICYLCSMDDHKGHDKVPAAAERAERQTLLSGGRQKIQQRIQDREREVNILQQRVDDVNLSAFQAVRDCERIFTELIMVLEKRRTELKNLIIVQQRTQQCQAKELEEKLQKELQELRRKDAELEKLSHTEDHVHFLNSYPLLSYLDDPAHAEVHDPQGSFKTVTEALSDTRDKLNAALIGEWKKISVTVTKVCVLQPQEAPRVGSLFLEISRQSRRQLCRDKAPTPKKYFSGRR